jgi:serine protease Do
MDNLTKSQFVLLVLLVSFMTSLVTGIVTVTLVNQAPPLLTQTIHRVIEKAVPGTQNNNEKTEQIMVITQEDLVIKLVRETQNAVVSIIASKDLPVIEKYYVNPFENDSFFNSLPPEFLKQFKIPQYRQNGTETKQVSSGTGFFVTADGLIVTNKHVVEDVAAEYTIVMSDGKKLPVKVLARDPMQDIAILKAEGDKFAHVTLGSSDNLSVGQSVVAIGNALGEFRNTVSVGVISGLMRTIVASGMISGSETLQEVIQTDAAINPGNSGGPLLDLAGRAIGINAAMAQGAQSIGFALPVNFVRKDIEDVQEFGSIKYAYLGVRYVMIDEKVKKDRNLSVNQGAFLADEGDNPAVMLDSPAAKAGLRAGDIILEFGGVHIEDGIVLSKLILKHKVGEVVDVKIMRGSETQNIKVDLTERPATL